MVLHVAKGSFSSNLARVSFPAEADKIRNEMVAVEDFGGWAPAHIIGGGGAANIAASYIERNALFSEEGVQTQKEADRPAFALTLAAPAGAVRLDLPASDNELERAKVVLRLDDLSGAAIRDVEIGYPWGHLLPNAITLEDASVLAQCVRAMSKQELRVFGAVLEVEEGSRQHPDHGQRDDWAH